MPLLIFFCHKLYHSNWLRHPSDVCKVSSSWFCIETLQAHLVHELNVEVNGKWNGLDIKRNPRTRRANCLLLAKLKKRFSSRSSIWINTKLLHLKRIVGVQKHFPAHARNCRDQDSLFCESFETIKVLSRREYLVDFKFRLPNAFSCGESSAHRCTICTSDVARTLLHIWKNITCQIIYYLDHIWSRKKTRKQE